MENLRFRKASTADLPRIAEIIRQAQAQMRAAGSDQWQNGYPAPADIARDIAAGTGYVLCLTPGGACDDDGEADVDMTAPGDGAACGGEVIAYGAASFDGEAAYEAIEQGRWLTEGPYVVLHRLAVADGAKRRGVAGRFMRQVEALAREKGVGSFRVDTNFDNRYMLRLVERRGFVYCGKVRYGSGERLAFEKVLDEASGRGR